MRAISSSSACSGLPSIDPSMASGSRMKRGECSTMIVCCAARPGAISLRPPEKPSIQCGSMKPSVMCRSASRKRRSIYTGVPLAVAPSERWSLQRARVVVDDAIARRNLRAEDRVDLFAGRAAMQAGRNQDRDAVHGNPGVVQPLQQRRQRLAGSARAA